MFIHLIGLGLLPWLLPADAQSASPDTAALVQTEWAARLGWDTAADACSCFGVTCNASRVVNMWVPGSDMWSYTWFCFL